MNLLSNIMTYKGERSRAVSPENPTGEKGKACGSKCFRSIKKRPWKH